jgi:hypothetical protein
MLASSEFPRVGGSIRLDFVLKDILVFYKTIYGYDRLIYYQYTDLTMTTQHATILDFTGMYKFIF